MLLFIAHGRREVVQVNITLHPTAAWVWRQLLEATPWGRGPRYLIRDRDRAYGGDCRARAEALGIRTLLTPIRPRGRTPSRSAWRGRSGTSALYGDEWAVGECHPREC